MLYQIRHGNRSKLMWKILKRTTEINSNVVFDEHGGCFSLRDWIQSKNINVVLMNPPYNAKPVEIPKTIKNSNGNIVYTVHGSNWTAKQEDGKADPSKGFVFVNYIADCIGKNPDGSIRQGAKLLCLLPLTCATGNKKPISFEKERILKNNTLDAVFSLPPEMFYPGANVNACCMVFTIGVSHYTRVEIDGVEVDVPRKETFLGYFKDDGFLKKKHLGRVSRVDENGNPLWTVIEQEWLDIYFGNKVNPYMGIRKKLTHNNEWLAEAYIETDYNSFLSNYTPFEMTLRQYLAF
jgi:type I restriction enzyme M protein